MEGYRSAYTWDLVFNDFGDVGSYWSSTVDGTYSRSLSFYNSNAELNSTNRGDAYSIRCIKD